MNEPKCPFCRKAFATIAEVTQHILVANCTRPSKKMSAQESPADYAAEINTLLREQVDNLLRRAKRH